MGVADRDTLVGNDTTHVRGRALTYVALGAIAGFMAWTVFLVHGIDDTRRQLRGNVAFISAARELVSALDALEGAVHDGRVPSPEIDRASRAHAALRRESAVLGAESDEALLASMWVEDVTSTIPLERVRSTRLQVQGLIRARREGLAAISTTLDRRWDQTHFLVFGIEIVALGCIGLMFLSRREARRRSRAEAELRETNEQLQRELIKSDRVDALAVLAGGIAHDFNNILMGLIGSLTLVRLEFGKGHACEARLREAERAITRARNLTRQLLTLSRGGAPSPEITNLAPLVKDTIDFALRGSTLTAEYDVAADLAPAHVDPGQICQVLGNLAINAVQASPNGGTLRVRARNVAKSTLEGRAPGVERALEISVADCGKGISPAHLETIFDPYFTTRDEGVGLGLATSNSIVERHGGKIEVESELGVGTEFRIFLPATATLSPAEEVAETQEMPGEAQRALVLDDDAAIRGALGDLLEQLGYESTAVADGDEATTAYQEAEHGGDPFDFVILDLTIPGGTGGVEVLSAIRAEFPDVVAIASSGYDAGVARTTLEEQGFAAFLPKPYTLAELRRVLSSVAVPAG